MDFAELQRIYFSPFFELIQRAREVYLCHWPKDEVQLCTLLSIKTGGCSEDCAYCAQSARYATGVESTALLSVDEVKERAAHARQLGATRFCMGTAWRGPRDAFAGSRYPEAMMKLLNR